MRKTLLLMAITLIISCKEETAVSSVKTKDISIESSGKNIPSTIESTKTFNTTDEEFNNWLKKGVSDKVIISKLGADHTVQNGEYSQVDGYYKEEWHYPEHGIILLMQSDKPDDDKNVSQITIQQSSNFKTSRGIGIGSAKDEVYKAYPDANQNDTTDDVIVAGNIYDGLFFTITDDKVSEIYIGALAE